ncbi:MAG: hypothetical protein GC184_00065 [Rhizobiales bacterium]|nr:hypothetical protein [Hyphomicrobiales bacterium]
MTKKPASLTGDLLARKGEATPLPTDPGARMTISSGRQPHLEGIGTAGHLDISTSEGLYGEDTRETSEMENESERPRPPEPEIIYTPDEDEGGGGRTRLIAAGLLGAVLIGGVILALSQPKSDSVAPLATEIADAPMATTTDTAPLAESTDDGPFSAAPSNQSGLSSPDEVAAALAPGNNDETDAVADSTAENALADSLPATAVPEAAEPEAIVPETVPAQVAETTPATPPAPVADAAPASGGAYVVQLLALRDEASAKTAWAGLVKKQPSLAGHALDIEKADLGDKGVYYRVRAAGFETKSAAASFCGALKANGQDCIVRKR